MYDGSTLERTISDLTRFNRYGYAVDCQESFRSITRIESILDIYRYIYEVGHHLDRYRCSHLNPSCRYSTYTGTLVTVVLVSPPPTRSLSIPCHPGKIQIQNQNSTEQINSTRWSSWTRLRAPALNLILLRSNASLVHDVLFPLCVCVCVCARVHQSCTLFDDDTVDNKRSTPETATASSGADMSTHGGLVER